MPCIVVGRPFRFLLLLLFLSPSPTVPRLLGVHSGWLHVRRWEDTHSGCSLSFGVSLYAITLRVKPLAKAALAL